MSFTRLSPVSINPPTARRSGRRFARGVTLIECLSVLSILATTVGLAAPSLDGWKQRQALLGVCAAEPGSS